MSATSMANVAISRTHRAPAGAAPRGRAGVIARVAEGEPEAPPDNPITAAMKTITTYIPTEVLTLYVIGVAIYLGQDPGTPPNYDRAWAIFIGGLIATPLVNFLVFLAKVRAAGAALPRKLWEWPIWESIAATVAFVFWAAALPDTPFSDLGWYDAALAGFLVAVVTGFLGLVSSIIAPPRQDSANANTNDNGAVNGGSG